MFRDAGGPFLTRQQFVLELSVLKSLTLFSATIGVFPNHKMTLSIIFGTVLLSLRQGWAWSLENALPG